MADALEGVIVDMLEATQPFMSDEGFTCFRSMINWAAQYDRCLAKSIEMDGSFMACMLTPFVGFGNPAAWSALAPMVTSHLLSILMKWEHDVKHNPDRSKEPLCSIVLIEMCVPFCAFTKDYTCAQDAIKAVQEIIGKHRSKK